MTKKIFSYLQNVASPEGDAGLSTWYEVVLEGIIVELRTHKDLQRWRNSVILRSPNNAVTAAVGKKKMREKRERGENSL